jgi:hypothetical protein
MAGLDPAIDLMRSIPRCTQRQTTNSNGGASTGGANDADANPSGGGASPNDGGGASPNDGGGASPNGGDASVPGPAQDGRHRPAW